jgi:hypothetical protein
MSLMETDQKPLKRVSPRKPIRQLDSRGERLCELMAFGTDDPEEAAQWGVPAHEPLSLKQAAPLAGLRMKNARFLFSETVFMKEYSRALASAKNGHRARAIQRIADIMDNEGEGTAADRKVQLSAAQALLNDGDGKSGSTNVNLQINNNAPTLMAGIVVRLGPDAPSPPLELQPREDDAQIIEGQAIQHHEPEEGFAIDPDAEAAMARAWPNTVSGDAD